MANLIKSSKSARWVFNCNTWYPTEADWLKVSSGIQEEEKIRIGKFYYKRDAKLSAAGRLLMRKYIVESNGMDWRSVVISRDDRGKPVFHDNSSLLFNVAHHGNYSVLAGQVGVNKLGIDIMKFEYSGGKSISEFFRIMNRVFSDHDWEVIKSGNSEHEQLRLFIRLWCLKESYVKATGTGITVNLKEISFKLNTLNLFKDKFIDDTELYLKGLKQTNWTFEEILIDDDHCVAVALNISQDDYKKLLEKHECFKLVEFGELLKNWQAITSPDVSYCRQFLSKEDTP